MASQLKVDTVTGVTTAGEITITLENSESQILQKGLAKLTANCTLSGSLNADSSLNVSSLADGGTGLNTVNATSAFSAAKAAVANVSIHDALYSRAINIDDTSASAFITRAFTSDGGALTDDNVDSSVTIHGDLA